TLVEPESPTLRITVVDGGVKRSILRLLEPTGAAVRVVPITATAAEWAEGADMVLFSNGPGDPAALPGVVDEIRQLVGKLPCTGICLGHQLLALALGASTYKLVFGHRGGNQPVRDERTGEVLITSQNHGFAVDRASLLATGAEVTHTHLNDQTVSGFVHADKRVYAVQFHPEAGPGPHDAHVLLPQFLRFARESA
ncbi:MAG: carbamoyl phosphate synthase small subunit, partial [Myxococcales bacterium]|nr:carbamoyl phosphate synthase small subunit [Myxococcales bacterium]